MLPGRGLGVPAPGDGPLSRHNGSRHSFGDLSAQWRTRLVAGAGRAAWLGGMAAAAAGATPSFPAGDGQGDRAQQ